MQTRPRSSFLFLLLLSRLPGELCATEVGGLAAEYLSEVPFPGLHVLEKVPEGPVWQLHPLGQHPVAAGREPIRADGSSWSGWAEARVALERALAIPEREPLQQDWRLFNLQGHPIDSLEGLGKVDLAFLIELGQWMWPAVRVGFEHWASGVNGESPAVLRTLSLRPVIFEVRDFISPEESEQVMVVGVQHGLHDSKGVLRSGEKEAGRKHTQFRTSRTAWLRNSLAPVIAEFDERVANLTRIPASHNEAVQLLRYDESQYYHGHMDWTELEQYKDTRSVWLNTHFGHQGRLATVFSYLNDVAEGGETIFPKQGQPICGLESRGGHHIRYCPEAPEPNMKSCEHGLKIRPRRGTVILWYNYHPNGRGDRNSLHAACPVGKDLTKWSANKWIRIKPVGTPGSWVEDHPAMARHGWVSSGGGSEAISNSSDTSKACNATFTSHAALPVDLMWYHPASDSYTRLQKMRAGETVLINSLHGRTFQVWSASASQRSNLADCRGPQSHFHLSDELQLRPVDAKTEL